MLSWPGRGVRVFALRRLGFSVGSGVYIGSGLTITAGILDVEMRLTIEDRVSVGPNATFVLASRPNKSRLISVVQAPPRCIHIGHDSWIGTGCIILPGVSVGKYCIVGAGSVVTKDVPDYCVVAGVPAKVIKTIEKTDLPE